MRSPCWFGNSNAGARERSDTVPPLFAATFLGDRFARFGELARLPRALLVFRLGLGFAFAFALALRRGAVLRWAAPGRRRVLLVFLLAIAPR